MAPRLVHLNGPPAIGKSTIARQLAAQRPMTVCVDIDELRACAPWGDDTTDALRRARRDGFAEVGRHLAAGLDVVVPQLIVQPGALAELAATGARAGAELVWIMLTAERDVVARRWREREGTDPWTEQARDVIRREGGDDLVLDYLDRLAGLTAGRDDVAVVQAPDGQQEETYDRVCRVLDRA